MILIFIHHGLVFILLLDLACLHIISHRLKRPCRRLAQSTPPGLVGSETVQRAVRTHARSDSDRSTVSTDDSVMQRCDDRVIAQQPFCDSTQPLMTPTHQNDTMTPWHLWELWAQSWQLWCKSSAGSFWELWACWELACSAHVVQLWCAARSFARCTVHGERNRQPCGHVSRRHGPSCVSVAMKS